MLGAMALYHLRVKFVKRSEGRSSVAASAYRSGTKMQDEREEKTHDYTRKRDIEYSEILLPEGLPEELEDRETLWNTVEAGIKRKDGQPAFEVEVALPRELTHAQCAQLARQFAQEQFAAKGLAVDLNIHRPTASDGGEHPHAHMLIGTRRFNPDGSLGRVATDMQDNPALVRKIYALEEDGKIDEAIILQRGTNLGHWREAWADYSNHFLEDSGSESRVDHRTLAAQQIHREASKNVGIGFYGHLRAFTGHMSERLQEWKAIDWRNAMRDQFHKIQKNRPDMTAEFIAHARVYAKDLIQGLDLEQENERDYDR